MANQCSTNLKSLTTKMVAAGMKTLPVLSVFAAAFFLFVGTTRAQNHSEPCTTSHSYCLFISDVDNSTVQLWTDDGTANNPTFLQGGGAGEGVSCLSGSANVIYGATFNGGPRYEISVFNLTNGGTAIGNYQLPSGNIGSLATNSAGTVLYAGNGMPNNIYGLATVIPPRAPWLEPLYQVADNLSHDADVGPNGNVFSTSYGYPNTGIHEYAPTLPNSYTQFLPGIPNNPCALFNGTQHCWDNLAGMAWDAKGNLWVARNNRSDSGNDGIFTFDANGNPLYFTPDPNGGPIGVTIAPPTDPSHPNAVLIANLDAGDIPLIDPSSCMGSVNAPGTCVLSSFISHAAFNSRPKYVTYYTACPNPDNNGHVEICKAGNTRYPPPNQLYDFTVTAPFFRSGPIQVPLGDCSGPIQVPSATLPNADTITETPVLGVLVSDVTAIAYNSLGMEINQLGSWTLPDLNATVGVQAGDVSLETVAIFTNYMVQNDGQLKICKIAGQPGALNQYFTFTVTDPLGQQQYMIPAGLPDQGGYCVLADQFPVNTQVTIAETPNSSFPLSNIAVTCDGCTYTVNLAQYDVTTTIGAGITEVDFTNVATPCNGNNLLTNGSFEMRDFTGWTEGGNFMDTFVVSGAFYRYGGAAPGGGAYYAVLGPVGSDGTLSQTFTTNPGQLYTVCFWLSAVGDNPSDFNAFWDGSQFLSLTDPSTGATSVVGIWKQFVYGPFTGTGSDTLTFSFRDDPEYIALDNVQVSDPHASPRP